MLGNREMMDYCSGGNGGNSGRGIQEPMEGCDGGEIDIVHLLLQCYNAQNLWSLVFSLFTIHWVILRNVLDTLCSWVVMLLFFE